MHLREAPVCEVHDPQVAVTLRPHEACRGTLEADHVPRAWSRIDLREDAVDRGTAEHRSDPERAAAVGETAVEPVAARDGPRPFEVERARVDSHDVVVWARSRRVAVGDPDIA